MSTELFVMFCIHWENDGHATIAMMANLLVDGKCRLHFHFHEFALATFACCVVLHSCCATIMAALFQVQPKFDSMAMQSAAKASIPMKDAMFPYHEGG